MSGYRSLHREVAGSFPVWQVATSSLLAKPSNAPNQAPAWRIWLGCGDGFVRGYVVQEKTLETQKDVLDASACNCICTHLLMGSSQSLDAPSLGCSQVKLVRNYVGEDDNAGDLIVASIDLAGTIRIWQLPEDMDEELDTTKQNPHQIVTSQEFKIPNATGTSLEIGLPRVMGVGDVQLAVPCLDGTIAILATGIATPRAPKAPQEAGSLIDRWSKAGSIAMSGDWHPSKRSLAVGRQDGLVEIWGAKPHRLIHHEAPVRAVAFTPDGNLLISGSDDGMLAVWDVSRGGVPVLVHHVVEAHSSWVLSVTCLADARRFISCGADRRMHVWNVGQMDQPLHSFTCDDTVWTIHAATEQQRQFARAQQPPRLVTGSEIGGLQIYSLEA
jgi:WD40 repeat protein